MKKARDDERITTIPKSAYEAGLINEKLRQNNHGTLNDIATDAQKNGYPVKETDRSLTR